MVMFCTTVLCLVGFFGACFLLARLQNIQTDDDGWMTKRDESGWTNFDYIAADEMMNSHKRKRDGK